MTVSDTDAVGGIDSMIERLASMELKIVLSLVLLMPQANEGPRRRSCAMIEQHSCEDRDERRTARQPKDFPAGDER